MKAPPPPGMCAGAECLYERGGVAPGGRGGWADCGSSAGSRYEGGRTAGCG